jgi:gluconolactonase
MGAGGSSAAGGSGASGGVAGSAAGMGGDSAGMAGTAGDSAGSSGSAGTGGGSNLHGGASGAFVCPPNPGTGDPLAGMSAITTISAPTMTQPSFFAFVEGPVWIASVGKLFFSDNAGSPERIWQLTPGMTPSVFFEGSGSNGLAIDGDDQLIVTDQVGNRITRVDPTASSPSHMLITAAGSKPNDIIVRSDGNIYFTAPNGGGTGFYRVDPSGMRTGPRTEVNAPNGIVLSPDENTLYVGDVGNRSITAFTIAADGSIGESGTPFATTVNATTDGMCVDCAGNVYAGTQNGVEVFSSTGMPRGTVMVGEASNCTFGGADRRTLYVTSRSVIKAVTLAIPGLPD